MLSASEITANTATVASALDQSLPLYRKSTSIDSYGHSTETYPSTPTLMLACNVVKPTATELQVYASIIAGKRAEKLRFLTTSDVREGDRIVYQGLNWRVQPLDTAESYSFSNNALIVTIS